MLRADRRKPAYIFFCTVLLTAALIALNASSHTVGAEGSDPNEIVSIIADKNLRGQPACCAQVEGDDKPHLLAASYYSFKNHLTTKLLLNNKGPNPLEARPTLFSLNGERLDIAPVTVEANSFRMIDMREWVASAGPQFREGSIQVFHRGRDLVLGAQVHLEDEARSLSFEEKLVEPAAFKSSKLGGLWWLPSHKGTVRLAVSNTSDLQLSVTASVNGEKPKKSAQFTFELAPHETRVFDVLADLIGQPRGAMPRFGGISLQHTGLSGAVLARAMAQDSSTGYSLAVQFSDPAAAKSSRLQGAGLRLGNAGGEKLSPVVVARNNGTTETVITGRIPYTARDGSIGNVSLPEIRLAPGEMSALDLSEQMRERGINRKTTSAGLEFEYSTAPGSVAIAAFSIGEGGNQLFRVPLWDIYAQRSSTGGYPWRIEGRSSTAVYIKNTAEHQQQYFLQLNHAGGVYAIGTKSIEGGQTVTYDVRTLRDGQVPDAHGQVIPMDATGGQIHWSKVGGENGVLIGRSEQADIHQGVSSNYACQNCCNDNPGQPSITPDNAEGVVGGTHQFIARQNLEDCYGGYYNSEDVIAQWTSSNNAIATVAAGTALARGAGTVTITAQWTTNRYTFEHPQEGNFGSLGECVAYGTNFSASATYTVKPQIDNLTPSRGLAGTTVEFKINGTGLKDEDSEFDETQVLISGEGQGQPLEITERSEDANQISITMTIAASATEGNHTVKVVVNGQTSNTVNYYVQYPRKVIRKSFPAEFGAHVTQETTGISTLKILTDGSVTGFDGATLPNGSGQPLTHRCGAYRLILYQLADAEGQAILPTGNVVVTVNETFPAGEQSGNTGANLNTGGGQTNNAGYVQDLNAILMPAGSCLTQAYSWTGKQHFTVTVGNGASPQTLSTVVQITLSFSPPNTYTVSNSIVTP